MYRSLTTLVPEELADDLSALLIEHGADLALGRSACRWQNEDA